MSFPSLVRVVALAATFALILHAQAQADTIDVLEHCAVDATETATTDGGSTFVSGAASCQGNPVPLVVKLTPQGAVDASWADGGLRRLSNESNGIGMSVLGDGSLVFAYANRLAKFDPAGSFDPAFGDNGNVETASFLPDEREIRGFTTDSQGRIVVLATGDSGALLARLTPNGELDEDFGTGGIANPAVPSAGFSKAIAVVTDRLDRVVFAGPDGNQGGAMRLLSDGTPDTSFGPSADGYAKSQANPNYLIATVRDVTIGPADSIQIVQLGEAGMYCFGLTFVSSLDSTGEPTTGASGAKGCEIEDWTPVNRDGFAGDAFATSSQGRGFPDLFVVSARTGATPEWISNGAVSPADSGAHGVEYAAATDRIVATGFATGGDCAKSDCPLGRRIIVRKFDPLGNPDTGFGKGGIVYLPTPTCRFGSSGDSPQPAWPKCRIKPPQTVGSAVIKGRRNPALTIKASLIGPPEQPGELIQRVNVGIPSKLRLKKGLGTRNLIATASSEVKRDLLVKVSGRRVILTYRPYRFWNDLRNEPVDFTVKFKRGTFKPLSRKVRIRKLWVPGRAANIPFDDPDLQPDFRPTAWYGTSSAQFGLRVKP